MATNDGKIILNLDVPKTAAQINADILKLQKQLKQVKATGALDSSATVKQMNRQIAALQAQLKTVRINPYISTSNALKSGQKAGQAFASAAQAAVDGMGSRSSSLGGLSAGNREQAEEFADGLRESENAMRGFTRLSATFRDQMGQAKKAFTQWLSAGTAVAFLIAKTKNALSELAGLDTLLAQLATEGGSLSRSGLEDIMDSAFDTAGRYGAKAADYLTAVREASRAGYRDAAGIAELALAAQRTGGMTAELAGKMIAAADGAYGLDGSAGKLAGVLDGMNSITNHSSVTMTELAEGMSAACRTAASLGVGADRAAAALGAMIDATGRDGSEASTALRTLLLLTGQVADQTEGISAENLAEYETACRALNVSLKETKNGVLSLREPMEVLGELAAAYSRLDEADPRRGALLDSVGGGSRAELADALLEGWDTYETMLRQYAGGTGSMAQEAAALADTWEGSLDRLSNTWTETVGNLADSDIITGAVNALNSLLSAVNALTGSLGSLGTIGLGAGLFAGLNNVGGPEMSGPVCY